VNQLHLELRARRVLATGDDGTVISLPAGASAEEALRSLRDARAKRGGAEGAAERPVDAARHSHPVVNGRVVKAGYRMRNGDVLGSMQLWRKARRGAAAGAHEQIEAQAAGDAGESADTRYWAGRMPWPWSLIQSDYSKDVLSWKSEAERKHGNVAILSAMTWLWLLALGWVHVEAPPVAELHGIVALSWVMQFGTFSLFEARSLLRNSYRETGRANMRAEAIDNALTSGVVRIGSPAPICPQFGPSLGPLEPPRWLGRVAMVMMTLLALRTDVVHSGGVLHDFLELGTGVGTPLVATRTRPATPSPTAAAVDTPSGVDAST
jgi:hypothetical protein